VPQPFELTPEHRAQFDLTGVLRLDGLISPAVADRAREAILDSLARLGLWRDGAWALPETQRPRWPDPGVSAKAIGRRPEAETLIEEPALLSAVDRLLDGRPFDRKLFARPQVLVTLPNAESWSLPSIGWHVDSPRLPGADRPGVQLFAVLDRLEPGGGGTLVVAGSHRLLNDGRFIRSRDVGRLLRREAFFRDLLGGQAPPGGRLPNGASEEVELEVVELTGAPGDVWLLDMRVLHSGAPNASGRPRIMATHRFYRADLMGALTDAPYPSL
jgi:hypothetical protein